MTPFINESGEQFETLDDIIKHEFKTTRYPARDRPYDGQPHTDQGERGKQLVEGLTMRDIVDCLVKAFLECSCKPELYDLVQNETWTYEDVYCIPCNFDPLAVAQGLTCNIEKMMGIFPNVPRLMCSTMDDEL